MADETKAGIIGERWAKDSDALAEGVLIKNESATVGFAVVRGWGGVPTREECEEIAARIVVEHNAYEPMRASLDRLRRVLDAMHQPDNGARRDPLRIAGLLAQARQEVAAALRAADGEGAK